MSMASVSSGSYSVGTKVYTYSGMDSTSPVIHVWYPDNGATGQKFPFLSYAHGYTDGTTHPLVGKLGELLTALSSYGYIVAAHVSCDKGCSDGATLSGDPKGYANYYKQQLAVIDWAKTQTDEIFSTANFTPGVGVAGHSMGGQATLYSSSEHGSGHGIKAAVMHHPYTHSFPAPVVPFLAMSGTTDNTAPISMCQGFFDAEGASPVRGIVNKVGVGHQEPCSGSNVANVAKFTAAWFKLFVDNTPEADGNDYNELVFGTGTSSLCHGGDGSMRQCELYGPTADHVVV